MILNKKDLHSRKENNKGAAMVIVLCVMILFFVLSLTIIFASSVLVGKARNDRRDKQCQILATSFTRVIETCMAETRDYSDANVESGTEKPLESEVIPQLDMKYFQDFVRAHVDRNILKTDLAQDSYDLIQWKMTWGSSEEKYRYDVNVDPKGTNDVSKDGYSMYMEMYWTFADEEGYAAYLRNGDNYERYQDMLLVVDVVCQNQKNAIYRTHSLFQLAKLAGSANTANTDEIHWYDYSWHWTMIGDKA